MTHTSAFKIPDGEAAFLAAYEFPPEEILDTR
jgi:hypothetical protein